MDKHIPETPRVRNAPGKKQRQDYVTDGMQRRRKKEQTNVHPAI